MASPISLSGLGSGIDTDSLVTKLVAANRSRITSVQAQQTKLQSKQSGVNKVNDKLAALESTIVTLSDQAKIAVPTAASTGSEVKVTADGSAAQGSYDVRVAQLAKAERSYSSSFADKSTTGLFGAGNLRISVSGSDFDIEVTATDTLESVASKINSATGDVQASVFSTGSGYRLQVAGQKTGTDNAISFQETGVSLGLSDPGAEVVSAQNAVASVDGFVVTSQTNTLSSVLSGLTLQLQGTTSGATYDSGTNSVTGGSAATVSVSRDAAALKTSITSFITAYNDVMGAINTQNGKSPDPTLLTVASKLRAALRTTVTGLAASSNSLAQIGIATNKDGTVRLDETLFNKKASEDFGSVVGLFANVAARKGVADAFKVSIDEMQQTGTGLIAAKQDSINKNLLRIADRIDTMNMQLDAYEARLKKQFTAMEEAIAKINASGNALTNMLKKSSDS